MSTRYGDRGFGRYGDSDEDRTEDYERKGERGYGREGGRARRDEYDSRARGYGRGGGEYSSQYGGSRYGREGEAGGGYAGSAPRRYAGEDYGRGYDVRDYAARGFSREYPRRYGRDEERAPVRDPRDERDEVRSFDTDYGRTTSRFYGRSGYEYGRDDYDDRDDRRDYRGHDYDRRDEGRGEGGVRGWLDRAAEGVRSLFGEEGGGRGRHGDDPRGGRGGFRGRGPRNYHRSDDRIRDDVSERLADNDWLDASDVEVNVVAGEVILTGTVDSRYAKRLAEEISESASGVSNVQNNLRVRSQQAADFDSTVTAVGANAATGGATGSLSDVPLPTAAHDIAADRGPASSPTPDEPDAPPTGRTSRAAGGS